jgi:RNA polymerase sigma-70 factor (ECF subfamily)
MISLAPTDEQRAGFEREALVHLDALYRAALRLTGSAPDAQDLVQETMLKAFRAWHQYAQGTNARAWLLTILRNTFINEQRRRAARPATTDLHAIEPFAVFDERPEADPEAAFFDSLVDDDVVDAIAELPVEYREVLALTAVDGLSYEESARVLAVPLGTIKSRLFRARKLLQARLREYAVSTGWIGAGGDRPPIPS